MAEPTDVSGSTGAPGRPGGQAPAWAAFGPYGAARPRHALVALLALVAIASSAWWVHDRLTHVHVSDARIAATMITISSRVSGWLEELPFESGDRVRRGDLLIGIDDREAALALREAELAIEAARAMRAQIDAERTLREASIESRIRRARSQRLSAEAERAAAETELEHLRAEWQRAQSLLAREQISREAFERQRNAYRQADQSERAAAARLEAADAALAEAEAQRLELELLATRRQRAELDIEDATARHERLEVALSHHRIRSPIDGVIDTVFVDPGEYVERGRQLLMLHDPEEIWVNANVRETRIRHLQPGDKARIRVDAYPGLELEGVIRRIGDAATSEFALFPDPSPGGNFTKVTQRIEVRIDLPEATEALKPGMMVEAKIGI